MPSFFYDYPETSGLREALYSSRGTRRYFEIIEKADSRLHVDPAAQPRETRALSLKLGFALPPSLTEFWGLAASVRMRHDFIVFSPEQVLVEIDLMKSYEIPDADRYLYVGEMGDGDMFVFPLAGGEEVFLWSHETHDQESCGDVWRCVADHVSWRIRHMYA